MMRQSKKQGILLFCIIIVVVGMFVPDDNAIHSKSAAKIFSPSEPNVSIAFAIEPGELSSEETEELQGRLSAIIKKTIEILPAHIRRIVENPLQIKIVVWYSRDYSTGLAYKGLACENSKTFLRGDYLPISSRWMIRIPATPISGWILAPQSFAQVGGRALISGQQSIRMDIGIGVEGSQKYLLENLRQTNGEPEHIAYGIKAITLHEFAHQIHAALTQNDLATFRKKFNKDFAKIGGYLFDKNAKGNIAELSLTCETLEGKGVPSVYATRSIDEDFAETFALYFVEPEYLRYCCKSRYEFMRSFVADPGKYK